MVAYIQPPAGSDYVTADCVKLRDGAAGTGGHLPQGELACASIVPGRRFEADQREADSSSCRFAYICFPSCPAEFSPERPGAVKGAPLGAAEQALDSEDRSGIVREEGKQMCVLVDLRNRASETGCQLRGNHGSI